MRFPYLLCFIWLTLDGFAQNLVPNPGFEENSYGQVRQWLQPVDDFYHYEVRVTSQENQVRYNAVNGLCLLFPDPSEFMLVKLSKPLQAGKVYCVSLKVTDFKTFIGSPFQMEQLEILFTDTPVNVSKRKLFQADAPLKFPIWDRDQNLTQPPTLTYKALGGEAYLIIGKFHPSILPKSLAQRREAIWKAWYAAGDSIKKYYKSRMPKPQGMYEGKLSRKELRLLNDSLNRLEEAKINDLHANAQYHQQLVDNLMKGADSFSYHVRFYLDDICVTPYKEGVGCECQSTVPTFKAGQTYRLNNIHFDLDKATFKPESFAEMNNLIAILEQYPKMVIQLNGHTDSLNTDAYNLELSNRRAKAVYDYVVSKGIAPKRLKWKGFGESKPLTENSSEEGRAINRRVEFLILSND